MVKRTQRKMFFTMVEENFEIDQLDGLKWHLLTFVIRVYNEQNPSPWLKRVTSYKILLI